jgi:predicted nucleotidyltransferase
MKTVVGIVAEFNPLHEGHKLLLRLVRRDFPDAIVVVAMSGNSVQRGEFAIEDKFKRTSDALANGADLVVELPTLVTLNSANYFAEGSIALLRNFKMNHIAFGSETNDPNIIMRAAEAISAVDFDSKMEQLVKETQSYPIAFATLVGFGAKSNDILASSYIAALIKAKDDSVDIISLERDDSFPTASSIRKERIEKDSTVMNMDHF